MNDINSLGSRIQRARKLRAMSQDDLAQASGVSLSRIRELEQDPQAPGVRNKTLLALAEALHVRTTDLLKTGDAEQAHPETAGDWTEVTDELRQRGPAEQGPPASEADVLAALRSVQPALAENRYAAVRPMLPGMIRDARSLNGGGNHALSRVLNLTAWLLVQTRQWDDAAHAAELAADATGDRLRTAAAVSTACWSLLRQGLLPEARDLGTRYADAMEPRPFSAATDRELALWGRLLLGVTNAAIRDNRPGEAREALSLAQSAAVRIGREIVPDGSTTRTFGPVTVAMIMAENYAITRQPDRVLDLAQAMPGIAHRHGGTIIHPLAASRCRHRLDVASALVMRNRYAEAMGLLRSLHSEVPEWLVEQRYARDIVREMIDKRRSPTREMLDIAAAVRLEL